MKEKRLAPRNPKPAQARNPKSFKPKGPVRHLEDPFEHPAVKPVEIGGKERLMHDIEILMVEWSVKHPSITPIQFLTDIKGYTYNQAQVLFKHQPPGEWLRERESIRDKITENIVRRHIDLIAEVQDTHIRASKLTLAKAVEMLSKMQIEPMKDASGTILVDKTGRPLYRGFRSIDLLNCASTIEKAQQIYRRAMGLPNDEGGLAQILEKLEQVKSQSINQVQNNLTLNISGATTEKELEVAKKLGELSYESVLELIERRRELKALSGAVDENLPSDIAIEAIQIEKMGGGVVPPPVST